MQIKTWEDTPAHTINKVLRNHIEVSVDIFHDARNNDIESTKCALKNIMQGASTFGHHLAHHYMYMLRRIIDKYLDEQTDILLDDDTDWDTICSHFEYILRLQMLMGALKD